MEKRVIVWDDPIAGEILQLVPLHAPFGGDLFGDVGSEFFLIGVPVVRMETGLGAVADLGVDQGAAPCGECAIGLSQGGTGVVAEFSNSGRQAANVLAFVGFSLTSDSQEFRVAFQVMAGREAGHDGQVLFQGLVEKVLGRLEGFRFRGDGGLLFFPDFAVVGAHPEDMGKADGFELVHFV